MFRRFISICEVLAVGYPFTTNEYGAPPVTTTFSITTSFKIGTNEAFGPSS